MIRTFAALTLLALGTASLAAQEAAPAAPAAPSAPANIVVDPLAPIDNTPKNANLLTGLYATKAVIELCSVTVDPAVLTRMTADQRRFESGMGMDEAAGDNAYAGIKADVERTTPDCADGSTDRQSVDAVVALYANQNAAAAPASPPAAPTTPPAAPAPDAAPGAPAAPAPEAPAAPAQ